MRRAAAALAAEVERARRREAPSWVAAMLGDTSPEMLFSVYARYISNRTRRDGSALLGRITQRMDAEATERAGAAVLRKYSR